MTVSEEQIRQLRFIIDDMLSTQQSEPVGPMFRLESWRLLSSICTELLAARREWQPIETAPKNREFLACSKTLRPFIAHWGNPLGWLDSVGLQRDPTHWRHLPPPPETAV